VLGIPYNAAIDMWSFGCILYELSVGYPLFPGEDEKDHMALMMEVKGVPPRSVLAQATRRRVFFDDDYQPILVPNSKGKLRQPNGKNLTNLMNSIDPDFIDFIDVSNGHPLFKFSDVLSGRPTADLLRKQPFLILSSQRPSMNSNASEQIKETNKYKLRRIQRVCRVASLVCGQANKTKFKRRKTTRATPSTAQDQTTNLKKRRTGCRTSTDDTTDLALGKRRKRSSTGMGD
jgi:serine/threonine protein kinase